ncbi:armadillo-type protein [Lentinula lateritia]|uniref:Armadillo-type protein n=1 Tax=Lentinula lateritia TaxID=40482 RepID=A0ABQ8V1G0_9AGAR|nr:armadillo-type protein [Lentinula lateritia]
MAATTTKKRPAKSQSGPAPKKVKKTDIATGKLDTSTTKKAKRSIPVTLTTSPPNDSENTDDEDDWEDAEDNVDFDGQAVDDDNAMQVDSGEGKTSARESHIAQKVLQQSRKAAKPHSDLISEAKRVWALARSQSISANERKKHISELMNVVRGKVKLIVFKHDASRIIQTLVKYGGKAEREEICEELKGSYADSAKNRYAKFLLLKLIRLLPSHRTDILSSFHGHVLSRSRLLLHREASGVLADAFELYANGAQRADLVKEFYGKEVALFSQKQDQDEKGKSSKGLIGVLETIGSDKEKKARVLAAVKENLISIFNNPDKGAVRHAIVHCATWEYLDVLGRRQDSEGEDAAKEAEKLRRDLFENCAELLPEMVHTKDGSRVAREFLTRGNAKDRKTILKTLKPHIERMCLDDEAQMVLFTAIDVIDDTKLLQKSVASIITTSNTLNTLVKSPQGRRAIIYLLIPRSRRYFTIAQIRALGDTDNARDGGGSTKQGNGEGATATGEGTSKKSPEVRQEEVRRGASEALLTWVKEQGAELAREAAESLIIADIMLHAEGDKSSPSQALLRGLTTPYPASSTSSASSPSSSSSIPVHPLDLPHTSRLYKNLLQGGHFNHSLRTVEISPRWDPTAFAVEFVKLVGGDDGAVIKDMCTKGERNGSFVVAQLCEALVREDASSNQEVKDSREKLKQWLSTSETLKAIEEGEKDGAKGIKVLLDGIGKL